MLTQDKIKQLRSLRQRKSRTINRAFIAEGPKLVSELIGSKFKINAVYGLKGWIEKNQVMLENKNIPFYEIKERDLEKISSLETPHDVLAEVNIPDEPAEAINFTGKWVLALDEIKDPGNLGTIIRTADWFGINNIVCSENTVDIYNPKVIQSTMGSIARVDVIYTDMETFLRQYFDKTTIYGTFTQGKDIATVKDKNSGIVIIGNESRGISENLEKYIHQKISIPSLNIDRENYAESLNASIAAGIICYAIKAEKLSDPTK